MSQLIAKGKSLVFTSGGQTHTITALQNCTLPPPKKYEFEDFRSGDQDITTAMRKTETAEVTVEIADMAIWAGFTEGDKVTDLTVLARPAKESDGTELGADLEYAMSHAYIAEMGELSMGNDNDAPVVGSIKFKLNWPVGLATRPTAGYVEGA